VSPKKSIPRSLRMPKRRFNTKAVKTLRRRTDLAKDIRESHSNPPFSRKRTFSDVKKLFSVARLGSVKKIIEQKVTKEGKCVVFEIGHGFGIALETMLQEPKLANLYNAGKLELKGMDVTHSKPNSSGTKFFTGNVLTKPFPKADVIFSLWSLGYVGNLGYMTRKVAKALKPKGVAVLHVNTKGVKDLGGWTVFRQIIWDKEKLAGNILKIQIPSCTIRIFKNSDMREPFGSEDLIILIEKKGN